MASAASDRQPLERRARRREYPFRERNPVTIGATSIAVLFALMIVAFKAGNLPLIGGGDTYYADFNDSAASSPTTRSASPVSGSAR